MLSKFSVKKPLTIIVSAILVSILGFISFSKMTTDLLPSMDLPYVIVMTTYPGASPVSYTHLDVYKRQGYKRRCGI